MPDRDREVDEMAPGSGPVVRLVESCRDAREPIRLCLNGGATLLVVGEKSIDLLLDLVDRLEMLEEVRRGSRELDQGQGLTLEQAKDRIGRTHGLSL